MCLYIRLAPLYKLRRGHEFFFQPELCRINRPCVLTIIDCTYALTEGFHGKVSFVPFSKGAVCVDTVVFTEINVYPSFPMAAIDLHACAVH